MPERWFITYRKEGLEELLVSRVGEQRGPTELVTQEAFEKSCERPCEEGRDRHRSPGSQLPLRQRGALRPSRERRRALEASGKVKLETGRPRHEKADEKEQEAFKKSSPGR